MNIYNAEQNNTEMDRCSSEDMAHIQFSYTDDLYDVDYDPEAEFDRFEQILNNQIKDFDGDPTTAKVGHGPDVYIGFDSEFVSGKKGEHNTVLSLQFFLVGERGTLSKVVYPTDQLKENRPCFHRTISGLILDALEKRIILEWPNSVIVCGFFLRLDLPAFSDLITFKTRLKNVAGRIASKDDVEFEPDSADVDSLLHSKTYITNNGVFNRLLRVKFVDLGSHVAVGTSIKQMGELINLPKLDIPEGFSIERMDLLLLNNKAIFEAYGLRDSEIAVRYYEKLQVFAEKYTGSNKLPITASGLAVKMFVNQLNKTDVDFNQAFGKRMNRVTRWNNLKGKVVTDKKDVMTDMHSIIEPFLAKCYSGGRNECYTFGPSTIGEWQDFDLAGAYTTGLVDLRHIDYDNFRITHDVKDFVGHVLGFAYIEFNFPSNTRYPSLPVRGNNDGLFYPLTGFSYCSAPEIEVALNLGCEIVVKHGVIIPWLEGDARLFEPYVVNIRELRQSYVKGSIDELYAKLLGNSLYGKTAQGLKKKTVFDAGKMTSVELDTSQITNAAMAAHTTGFIRAVLSEQIAGIPSHRKVLSATTDGFITDATIDQLDSNGTMAKRFKLLCERVSPGSDMLEQKHQVRQVVAMKTRGQITGIPYNEDDPVNKMILAKCGVSPPHGTENPNDYMLRLFLNRKPGDMTQTKPFTSIREQWNKDLDVVRDTRESLLNLEFDFKRKLIDPVTMTLIDRDHISLESIPWTTIEEAERARAIFDGWRRKRCLKDLDDWHDFDDHYQFSTLKDRLKLAGKTSGMRNIGKGIVDVFRRLFLRAYSQELCGLTKSKTYTEMAKWLTENGYPTSPDDVKNAKRSPFIAHVIPATVRMKQFASLLCAGFPNIDINQFFEIILEE